MCTKNIIKQCDTHIVKSAASCMIQVTPQSEGSYKGL